ncbi:MAG TPA: PTS sugar transporter subunit IIA, partial [bacterium]|nr:PTS sugar transporter subunit IIA [bacterium]
LPSEIMHYDDIYQCPSCSRFLYPYSGEKLDFSQAQAHSQLPRLGIDKFSSERLMMPALTSSSGREVIHEMAQQIADELFFPHPELLTEKALEREVIMSTAVEHGLAFPHVRGVDGSSLTLAVGLKNSGIKFGAPRGRLTRIFFFAVIPVAASAFYLKLLAGLVETFREKTARDALLECGDQKSLWKAMKRFTRKHLP